jgi:hypothetical protein
MAHALQHAEDSQQLALYRRVASRAAARVGAGRIEARGGAGQVEARADAPPVDRRAPLCAGCRSKEARYGFRDAKAGELRYDRPRTLCFECFRVEIDRRQAVAAQLKRGWNAEQAPLPLEATLRDLTRRRRGAQIAARHALELR